MGTKQCPKCVHDEMCRYKEQIDDLREQYPFIADITCCRFLKPSAFLDEMQDVGSKKSRTGKSKQNTAEKQELVSQSLDEEKSEKDDADNFDSLSLERLYLDNGIVQILKNVGICTVKDIYTYDAKPDANWLSIPGMDDAKLNALNIQLNAFNKPVLNALENK